MIKLLMPHHYLGSGVQGFVLFRNNADVEDSRENENEAGSRRGTCEDEAERLIRKIVV